MDGFGKMLAEGAQFTGDMLLEILESGAKLFGGILVSAAAKTVDKVTTTVAAATSGVASPMKDGFSARANAPERTPAVTPEKTPQVAMDVSRSMLSDLPSPVTPSVGMPSRTRELA